MEDQLDWIHLSQETDRREEIVSVEVIEVEDSGEEVEVLEEETEVLEIKETRKSICQSRTGTRNQVLWELSQELRNCCDYE